MSWLRDKLYENIFSAALGIAATTLTFYITSPPVLSDEFKISLSHELLSTINEKEGKIVSGPIKIDGFQSIEMGLDQSKTVFIYGHVEAKSENEQKQEAFNKINDKKIRRVWGVLEPSRQGLLDKIVGRPGFYKVSSYGYADVGYSDELTVTKIETLELDGVGSKAIVAELDSQYADRTSHTFLLMRRDQTGKWHQTSLPPMSKMIENRVSGNLKLNEYGESPLGWFCCFSSKDDKKFNTVDTKKIVKDGIYEDEWTAFIDGKEMNFTSISNGGKFMIRKHAERGHLQVFVLGFSSDQRAVQSAHHVIATMLSFGNDDMKLDELWNWGYPIISVKPLNLSDIDQESIMKAGIEAHINGETFFGYTEFHKRK